MPDFEEWLHSWQNQRCGNIEACLHCDFSWSRSPTACALNFLSTDQLGIVSTDAAALKVSGAVTEFASLALAMATAACSRRVIVAREVLIYGPTLIADVQKAVPDLVLTLDRATYLSDARWFAARVHCVIQDILSAG